jgi:predicted RNA-binding Zn-ribbon protein involved in translation (DUF1610 family)
MPIIIWGSRGLTSTRGSGTFYCPRCDSEADYALKQVRPFFTIYFIPLFPIGAAQRYVECHSCGGTFKEEVLDMGPPTEGQRALTQLYQDLQTGSSLEDAEARLVSLGLEKDRAREVVEEMTEGDTWACPACGDRYLKAVRRCTRCR